jgi:hypothetical protein
MTHEQFVWWLDGFLDGGADIEHDVRDTLREKLSQIGTPTPKQAVSDRPRTPADALKEYTAGIGIGAGSVGRAIAGLGETTFLTNAAPTRDPVMAELSAAARACE